MKSRALLRAGVALGVLVSTSPSVGRSVASEEPEPRQGDFLVARESISGGPFEKTVVFLVRHNDEGTLGLIVNRRTDASLRDVVENVDDDGPRHPLHFGGPVGLEGLMLLFRSNELEESAHPVKGDVYMSGELEVLKRQLEANDSSERIRVFIGHSGWAPGQLASELRRDDWDVVRADPARIFTDNVDTMWDRLRKPVMARTREQREDYDGRSRRSFSRASACALSARP